METRNEVSAAEAARRLGVTLGYVYLLLWTERLPARKVGGRWRIASAAVEERLKEREARHGSIAG